MPANKKEAQIVITALNNTDKAFSNISKQFAKIEKNATRLGRNLSTTLTAPIVAGLGLATSAAVDFEKVMLDVKKNVKGIDASNFKEVEASLLKIGSDSLLGAEGIARLTSEGGKLGKSTEEALKFAAVAERMAVAFDFDRGIAGAEEAGRIIGKLESSFSITTEEVGELADSINFFGDNTASNARNITAIMVRQGAVVANVTKLTRKEITALAATFDATAPSPEIAATGLKNFALALTAGEAATDKQSAAFLKLGFNTKELAKRMQTDAKGAIIDVVKALGKLPEDQKGSVLTKIFGKESIGAIAPVVADVERLEQAFNNLGNTSLEGSALNEFERINNADSSALTKSLNALQAAGITIGQVVLPPLAQLAGKVSEVAMQFQEFALVNPQMVEMGVVIAGIVAAAGPMLLIFGQLAGAVANITALFSSFAGAGVSFAALTGPVGIAVAAIVGGVALIIANWESVKAAAMSLADFVVQAFEGWKVRNADTINSIMQSWNSIKESASVIWNAIKSGVMEATSSIVSNLNQWLEPIGGLKGAWEALKVTTGLVFDNITTIIGGAFKLFSDNFKILSEVISGQKTVWEGFREAVNNTVSSVISTIKSMAENVRSALNIDLSQIGREIMRGLLGGITSGATAVLNKVTEVGNKISDTFKRVLDINSPSRVFKSFGQFIIAGLTLGMSNADPAITAANETGEQVIQAFRAKISQAQGSTFDLGTPSFTSDTSSLLGSAAGQLGSAGGQDPFSSGIVSSGGGEGEQGAFSGFFDANQAGEELTGITAYYDERLALLTSKGREESTIFAQVEQQKMDAVDATQAFQKKSIKDGVNSSIGLLGQLAGKQSVVYKAMFATSKAFALKEAVVSGFNATAKAFENGGGFPTGIPFAAATAVQSAGYVASIASTSFNGGGFTGNGARTGGVDGIGGFPATLHPNETVIDHTKGQGLGDTISVNVTITGDATDETVERFKNEAVRDVMAAIRDTKRRGGSRASSL